MLPAGKTVLCDESELRNRVREKPTSRMLGGTDDLLEKKNIVYTRIFHSPVVPGRARKVLKSHWFWKIAQKLYTCQTHKLDFLSNWIFSPNGALKVVGIHLGGSGAIRIKKVKVIIYSFERLQVSVRGHSIDCISAAIIGRPPGRNPLALRSTNWLICIFLFVCYGKPCSFLFFIFFQEHAIFIFVLFIVTCIFVFF